MPRRRQPKTVLGGSIVQAPNGYRAIPQYTPTFPTPQTVQQVYANARRRRYPASWDDADVDAALVIYLTDPFSIVTACHNRSLGRFVAYEAKGEYGILRDEAVQRHKPSGLDPGHFRDRPGEAFESASPTYWLEGEVAGRSSKAFVRFKCPKCGHVFEPRNLRRLGKRLFEAQPNSYRLDRP